MIDITNINDLQKYINSYGFKGFDIYERTEEWAAIDVEGESESKINHCIQRLNTYGNGVHADLWEHYIEIYIGEEH